jgi:ATP-binding cassette subfamily A (ABC1) protein 3
VGYTVTTLLESSAADKKPILDLFSTLIPEAEQLSNVGAEVSFRLPFSAASKFPDLFNKIDSRKETLRCVDYGVSVTTLEEVFLMVASGERENADGTLRVKKPVGAQILDPENTPTIYDEPLKLNDGIALVDVRVQSTGGASVFCGQLSALLMKRFNYARRDVKNLICQVVVPAILVLQGLILLTFFQFASIAGGPELVLAPADMFNDGFAEASRNFIPFRVPQPPGTNAAAEAIRDQFDMDVVKGQFVDVPDPQVDAFASCAQGPAELAIMNNFLLTDANYDYDGVRYGAVTFDDSTDATAVPPLYAYNVMVNASAVHGAPAFMNLVNTAIMRTLTTGTGSITVSNKPMPLTLLQEQTSQSGDAFSASTYIVIGFAFLPASYAIFVVRERETGAKHQQLISGVSLPAYWLATYIWDVVSYLVPSGLVILFFVLFDIEVRPCTPIVIVLSLTRR